MPLVVVIPVRGFGTGKARLASALEPEARSRLARALAEHVAATVADAGHLPLVVTADPEVAGWAASNGFAPLPDPGRGLDEAAAVGVTWALEADSPWLVLHADLPLLRTADIAAAAAPLDDGRPVLAPSADGGTSAIGARGEFGFAYGPASFHRHLARLGAPTVVTRPGLALDVDSPVDIDAALSAGADWVRAAIR